MSPTRILLFAALGLGGLLVFAGTAKAAEPEPLPPQAPNPSSPPDDFPWMRYSDATLARQEDYNAWATVNGWPTIKADGILGPNTCEALTNWWQNGGPAVPSACSNAARYKTCQDAAAVRAEWQREEDRRINGDPFYDADRQDDLYAELYKLERMCGDVQITGEGTRL